MNSLTVLELYEFARTRNLLDAPVRVCDGMAVSYYLEPQCMGTGRYEIVLDVSSLQPVDYDDLPR